MKFNIDNSTKNVYLIHKTTDTKYCLCKILKEYETQDEAGKDLVKLLTHKKSEKDLLKEYEEQITF